jgi:ankyrin repeat protein
MRKRNLAAILVLMVFFSACGGPRSIVPIEWQPEADTMPYHVRALAGDNFEAIKEAVESGADINQKIGGVFGHRPIYYAINSNKDRTTHYLIEQGVELNYKDSDGFAPLMYGAGASNPMRPQGIYLDTMELMLQYGADIEMKSSEGMTALDYAISNQRTGATLLLLANGAQVSNRTWKIYLKERHNLIKDLHYDVGYSHLQYQIGQQILQRYQESGVAETGFSPALEAAMLGDSASLLIDPSWQSEEEQIDIALYAAAFCSSESLSAVIEPVDESKYVNDSNYPPLCIAAFHNNIDVVKLLWPFATEAANENGYTEKQRAFEMGIMGGSVEVVQFFLDQGMDLQEYGKFGLASYYAQGEMMEYLIDKGVEAPPERLLSAARIASSAQNYEVYPILLAHGLDPNGDLEHRKLLDDACLFDAEVAVAALLAYGAKIDGGMMLTAVKFSSPQIVKLLLEQGADPNLDSYGETAIVPAVLYGEFEIIQLLVEHGAKIEFQAEDGWRYTALSDAAIYSNHILKYLLDQGGEIDFQDDEGNTALMYAVNARHTENVKLLIESGANPTLVNENGATVLSVAQTKDNAAITEMIEAYLKQWKS